MSKSDSIETSGVVVKTLPGTRFEVRLDNGHVIKAYLCGKMRQRTIRVREGDKVQIALSPYDLDQGRITYRFREGLPPVAPTRKKRK